MTKLQTAKPQTVKTDSPELVPFKEKCAYGIGDVSNGLAASSVPIWLPKYLTDVALLDPALAGVALIIGRLWDAVTDPLMGWISDHTRSRWGKRRPYLLFGALPFALSFVALWFVPEFSNNPQAYMFAYITIALLIFNTCFTVVFVPYTTLTAAITDDYNERTSLTGYRIVASQFSMFLGATLPAIFIPWINSPHVVKMLDLLHLNNLFGTWAGSPRQAYAIIGILFGCIILTCVLISFLGTRERNIEHKHSSATPFQYATTIVKELHGNRPFRISVLILLITNTAATFVAVNLTYYIQYVLKLAQYQYLLFATLFLTAIVCVPIWVLLARKFGKTEVYGVAMILYATVVCLLSIIQPGQIVFASVIAMLAGLFHAAALTLPWAIIPDVIEYDELKSGKRREGLFYGGTTFCYKLATAFAPFVSLQVLAFSGYVPNASEQSQTVIQAIRYIIGVLPCILLLSGAILSRRHPLTAKKHKEIIEALRKL